MMPPTETLVFDAPPVDPRRRRELIVVVVLILAVLTALAMGRRTSTKSSENQTLLLISAEQEARMLSAMEWAGQKDHPQTSWTQVEKTYRSVLNDDPRNMRARRGLAAVLTMKGEQDEAQKVVQHPVEIPAGSEVVWKATQVAYGALPRPTDTTSLQKSLEDSVLGWSRFVALERLATTDKVRRYWRDERQLSYAIRIGALGGIIGLAGFVFFFGGIAVLVTHFSRPRRYLLPEVTVGAGPLLGAFIAALLAQQALAMGLLAAFPQLTSLAGTAFVHGAGAALVFFIAHRVLKAAGGRIQQLGWSTRMAVVRGVAGYAGIVPVIAGAVVLALILQALLPRIETPPNPAVGLISAARGWEVIWVFVLACVIAPIVEELTFRGLLFRGLARRYGITSGAVVSSLIFAGLHLQLPLGFPMLLVIGLGLCFVYRATGSLVPCIIAHSINNTIALLAATMMLGRL